MEKPWKPEEPVAGTEEPEAAEPRKNTLTYTQKKYMERREGADVASQSLKPERLDPEYVENMRKSFSGKGPPPDVVEEARAAWRQKLQDGDYAGPVLDESRYLALRGTVVEGNPRQTEEYRKLCCEAVGVGAQPDKERYAILYSAAKHTESARPRPLRAGLTQTIDTATATAFWR